MSKRGFTRPRKLAHRSGNPRFEDGRPRHPTSRPNRGNFKKEIEEHLLNELKQDLQDWGIPIDGTSPEDIYYDETGRGDPDYVNVFGDSPHSVRGKRL